MSVLRGYSVNNSGNNLQSQLKNGLNNFMTGLKGFLPTVKPANSVVYSLTPVGNPTLFKPALWSPVFESRPVITVPGQSAPQGDVSIPLSPTDDNQAQPFQDSSSSYSGSFGFPSELTETSRRSSMSSLTSDLLVGSQSVFHTVKKPMSDTLPVNEADKTLARKLILTGKLFNPDGTTKSSGFKQPALFALFREMEQKFRDENLIINPLIGRHGLTRVGILTAWELKQAFNPEMSAPEFFKHLNNGVDFMDYVRTGENKPASLEESYLGFMWLNHALLGPDHYHRGTTRLELGTDATKRFYEFFNQTRPNIGPRTSTHNTGTRVADGLGVDFPELRMDAPMQSGNALFIVTIADPVDRLIAREIYKATLSGREIDLEKVRSLYSESGRGEFVFPHDFRDIYPIPKDRNLAMLLISQKLGFKSGISTKYELHGFKLLGQKAIHIMSPVIKSLKHNPKKAMSRDDLKLMTNEDGKLVKTSKKEHASTLGSKLGKHSFAVEGITKETSSIIFKKLVEFGILSNKDGAFRIDPSINVYDPNFVVSLAESLSSLGPTFNQRVLGVLKSHPNNYGQIIDASNRDLKSEGFSTKSKFRMKGGSLFERIATHDGKATSATDVIKALSHKVRTDFKDNHNLLAALSILEDPSGDHSSALTTIFDTSDAVLAHKYANILMGHYALNPNQSPFETREGREAVIVFDQKSVKLNGLDTTLFDVNANLNTLHFYGFPGSNYADYDV